MYVFQFHFFDLKDRRIDRRYKIFVNIYCVNLMKCIESSSNKWALYFLLAVPLFLKITISFMPSAKLWIRKENTQKNSIKLFWKLLDEIELKEQLDTRVQRLDQKMDSKIKQQEPKKIEIHFEVLVKKKHNLNRKNNFFLVDIEYNND